MEECFVYIIQSIRSGRFYIGVSGDVVYRLTEHNEGKVISTRNRGQWELRLVKGYPNERYAKQIEYKWKKLKSRRIIEKIIADGDIKMGL